MLIYVFTRYSVKSIYMPITQVRNKNIGEKFSSGCTIYHIADKKCSLVRLCIVINEFAALKQK